jgi:hypothetical protein
VYQVIYFIRHLSINDDRQTIATSKEKIITIKKTSFQFLTIGSFELMTNNELGYSTFQNATSSNVVRKSQRS